MKLHLHASIRLCLVFVALAVSTSAALAREGGEEVDWSRYRGEEIDYADEDENGLDELYTHFDEAQSHRRLNTPRKLGQRCRNHDACEPNLECFHLGFLVGKRCIPNRECLQEQIAPAAELIGSAEDFRASVLERAGITEDAFLEVLHGSPDRQSFYESTITQTVMDALKAKLEEAGLVFEQMIETCIGQDPIQPEPLPLPLEGPSIGDELMDSRQIVPSRFSYFGLAHIEIGFIFDFTYQYLFDYNENYWHRLCGGAEFGAGFEFAFVIGGTTTRNVDDVETTAFVGDMDLVVGAGVGFAFGIGLNGAPFIEMTIGFFLAAGIGGSVCSTFPAV